MVCIVVDDEQAKVIRNSDDCIMLRDQQGRFLGYIHHGFTDEDVAAAKQVLASNSPRYTTEQVLAHLRSLANQ
jgi:hypothetical protein